MADNNAEGQVAILRRVLKSESWIEFWNELAPTEATFEQLKLDRGASDAELWRACQRHHVVLITNNRNAEGPDSLEMVIRTENTADSLPVFTIANPNRVETDREYAEQTALRLLEYLMQLDTLGGAGRMFLP